MRKKIVEEFQMLTVTDVARTLRLCRDSVMKLIYEGELPAKKFGRAVRVREADLKAYINKNDYTTA